MSFEYYVKFDDQNWLALNLSKVKQAIENLESFTLKKGDLEFWLKSDSLDGGWSFDVRVFFLKSSLLLEVSSTTMAYRRDVKILLSFLNQQTEALLIDDDGEKMII